jgi:hypothetical protein
MPQKGEMISQRGISKEIISFVAQRQLFRP